MKNPPHPGRLIRDDIEAFGFSVAEAAESSASRDSNFIA